MTKKPKTGTMTVLEQQGHSQTAKMVQAFVEEHETNYHPEATLADEDEDEFEDEDEDEDQDGPEDLSNLQPV